MAWSINGKGIPIGQNSYLLPIFLCYFGMCLDSRLSSYNKDLVKVDVLGRNSNSRHNVSWFCPVQTLGPFAAPCHCQIQIFGLL